MNQKRKTLGVVIEEVEDDQLNKLQNRDGIVAMKLLLGPPTLKGYE